MMNDILRDLINTEEVVAFMDNVLVETEEDKGHDKIIEEVLKRMKENNLYVMNIEWDYSYYQPWSDNEWLVDEMLAIQEEMLISQNKDIIMQ